MRAAPELLAAPTTGGRSARPRGGGESYRSQISLPSRPKCTKTAKFAHVLANNLPKMPFFAQKYSRNVFRGIHEIWSSLLKPLQSYTSSKFRKSYTPPAARIRVNSYFFSTKLFILIFQVLLPISTSCNPGFLYFLIFCPHSSRIPNSPPPPPPSSFHILRQHGSAFLLLCELCSFHFKSSSFLFLSHFLTLTATSYTFPPFFCLLFFLLTLL